MGKLHQLLPLKTMSLNNMNHNIIIMLPVVICFLVDVSTPVMNADEVLTEAVQV